MRFKNQQTFIKHVIRRMDKNPKTIIGLGVGEGNRVTGYFYNDGNFYDYFVINTKFWDVRSAQISISQIRDVTNLYYYRS